MLWRSLLVFFIVSVISISSFALPPTTEQVNQARLSALAWLVENQMGDGSWRTTDDSSVRTTSAAVSALINAGIQDGHLLNSSLIFLQNANSSSIDSLSRQLYALDQADIDVSSFANKLVQSKNGYGTWGAYPGYGSSFPDTPLALLALFRTDNFAFNSSTAYGPLCDGFLYAKRADNSFSYIVNGLNTPTSQSQGSIIPTAYAVIILKQMTDKVGVSSFTCYRTVNGTSVPTTFNFNTTANNAAAWLATKQKADGGFGDGTISYPLETALAHAALNAASSTTYATQLGNALGYLVTTQGVDGDWNSDLFVTALAMQTLPTLAPGSLVDSDANGIPDDVETLIGGNPVIADRTGADGNGQSTTGVSYTQALSTGNQYANYSFMLPGGLGSPPFTWQLVSGSLPNGMSLNSSTGEISGWANTAGTFNFTYSMTDAYGSELIAAQITIAAAPESVQIPMLPPWAILMMGMALILIHQQIKNRANAPLKNQNIRTTSLQS